jgi:carbonic anhydrase
MHKAKVCIVSCIDFRFSPVLKKLIENEGVEGEYDLVSLAGASRDLVKPIEKNHQDNITRQLAISIKLHAPEEIWVVDHQDCGGYAQDGTIDSGLPLEEDKQKHEAYSKEIGRRIEENFSGVKVKHFYLDLEGNYQQLYG